MSSPLRKGLRSNGLTLAFTALFVLALVGQGLAGRAEYNNQLVAEGLQQVGISRYLTSSDFAVDVAENWQSEYLQFFLYVVLTVWLVQVGSPESKKPEDAGTEDDEEQKVAEHADPNSPGWAKRRGPRLTLYSNSLGLAMGSIFLLSWLAQSVAGHTAHNEELMRQLQDPTSWFGYVTSADFWSRTLQNWQSEFLAVASMCALSIYLRQRGSPESKPVGSPHTSTGVEG